MAMGGVQVHQQTRSTDSRRMTGSTMTDLSSPYHHQHQHQQQQQQSNHYFVEPPPRRRTVECTRAAAEERILRNIDSPVRCTSAAAAAAAAVIAAPTTTPTQQQQQQQPPPPPSSFKDPSIASSMRDSMLPLPSSSSSSASASSSSKRRPLSTEIGQKAKEAMLDFGRAARDLPRGIYNLRNLSRTDVGQTHQHTSLQVRSSSDNRTEDHNTPFSPSDTYNLIPTFSPSPNTSASHAFDASPSRNRPSTNRQTSDEVQLDHQAVGLGLQGVDTEQLASDAAKTAIESSSTGLRAPPHRSPQLRSSRRSSMISHSPPSAPMQLSVSEQLFASPRARTASVPAPSSKATTSNSASMKMDVDHVEISLDDVQNDSPVYRIVLQGLERRTAAVKRTAKSVIKAAEDTISAIESLQTSDARLDSALHDMTNVLPASFGILHTNVLANERTNESERLEETKKKLEEHIVMPMRALADMCREVSGQLKAFDAESKSYYSATQKWLSSRASSTANQTSNNANVELYSPEAVGFDKGALKQEKMDEKQRLRQARFDLARFEVYRGVCVLHAGEAEILVAGHLLALCRWQCRGTEARGVMRSYGRAAEVALETVRTQADAVRVRCQELEAKVIEQQRLMGKEVELQQTEAQSHATETDGGLSHAAARTKVKNLLSALGVVHSSGTLPLEQQQQHQQQQQNVQRAPLSCPIPPVPSFETTVMSSSSRGKDGESGDHDEFGVLSAKQETPSSTSKWQTRLRTFSLTKQPQQLESTATTNGVKSPRAHLAAHHHEVDNVHRRDNRSQQRRSMSFSGGQSPVTPMLTVDTGDQQTPSRQSSAVNTVAFASADGPQRPSAEHSMAPPSYPPSTGLSPTLQRFAMHADAHSLAVPTRKKEGILWAMTKPIQGASGTELPRAVSRSQNWRECWVVLSGSGHLGEYAHWKETKSMALESTQPMIDLRFATVREARGVERRFTFEVVTREYRRFFQASNEEEMRGWMAAIGMAIESLINGTSSVRQVDKVARKVGGISHENGASGDFGMRHVFDANPSSGASAALGIRTAFSQSLTDLGSSAGGRLFHRAVRDEENGVRNAKRDSRSGIAVNVMRGHLSALSEGGGGQYDSEAESMDTGSALPLTPARAGHTRGISNTTPVSGYIPSNPPHQAVKDGERRRHASSNAKDESTMFTSSSSSLHVSTDFDKRIEAMVNSSYGGGGDNTPIVESSSGTSSGFAIQNNNRDSFLSSTSPSRVPSSTGHFSSSADEEGRLIVSQSTSSTFNHLRDGSTKFSRASEIMAIASREDNRQCADCRRPDPRWASWCLHGERRCIFICIACSGVHRGLGVSVSKVRSVDLDDWTEEQLAAARNWGNVRVNALYEARKPDVCTVTSMGDTRTKAFWTAKYVERSWYVEQSDEATVGDETEKAVVEHSISGPSLDRRQAHELNIRKKRPSSMSVVSPSTSPSVPLQSSVLTNRLSVSATPSASSKLASQVQWRTLEPHTTASHRLST